MSQSADLDSRRMSLPLRELLRMEKTIRLATACLVGFGLWENSGSEEKIPFEEMQARLGRSMADKCGYRVTGANCAAPARPHYCEATEARP